MRQITYVSLFLLVFLSACAPRWIKPGMTEQQLAQDTIECREKASATAGDYPTTEAPPSEKKDIIVVWDANFDLCMETKGYVKQK
jgi:hypothetical protein